MKPGGPHWGVTPDYKFIYSELSFIITYSIFLHHILRYLNSMAFLSTFSGMESYWWTCVNPLNNFRL